MKRKPTWISLIILAAGKSTRFGSNKLLFKLDGKTLIERVVKQSLESKVQEVIVVVGYEAEKIKEILKNLPCKIVLNSYFDMGQSSSVKLGVKSISHYAKAVLILPGDVILVKAKHINKVIDKYHSTESAIVVASHKEKMGHPILIDSILFDEVLKIREETYGLKEIINRHRGQIEMVETGSDALFDLDIQEDLKVLRN